MKLLVAAADSLWAASGYVRYAAMKEFFEIYMLDNFSEHWLSYSKFFTQTLIFQNQFSNQKISDKIFWLIIKIFYTNFQLKMFYTNFPALNNVSTDTKLST